MARSHSGLSHDGALPPLCGGSLTSVSQILSVPGLYYSTWHPHTGSRAEMLPDTFIDFDAM